MTTDMFHCRNHNPVYSSFMTYQSNTMGATCGAGTSYLLGAPEFSPQVFNGVHVARSLVFCVMFCITLLFCCFSFLPLFCHVLIQFTASDYSFRIFKYFFVVMSRYSASYYSTRTLYIHSRKYMYKISDKVIICLFINLKHWRNIQSNLPTRSPLLRSHLY